MGGGLVCPLNPKSCCGNMFCSWQVFSTQTPDSKMVGGGHQEEGCGLGENPGFQDMTAGKGLAELSFLQVILL